MDVELAAAFGYVICRGAFLLGLFTCVDGLPGLSASWTVVCDRGMS